jgi:hypothetical protein
VFNFTTPYGKEYTFTSTVGGKRCIVATEDVGLVPGQFNDMLAGTAHSKPHLHFTASHGICGWYTTLGFHPPASPVSPTTPLRTCTHLQLRDPLAPGQAT